MSTAAESAGRDPPLTALRLRLRANGFPPVPVSGPHMRVKSAGKRPVMEDWRRVCAEADEAEVRGWATTEPNCTNTGILCDGLACPDIDVPVPELATRIEATADSMLGHTSLRRIGQAPKSLLAYRTTAALPKMATPELFLPDGTKVQVEILGAGQQFVAYGEHPDTGHEYVWPEAGPDVVARTDLPVASDGRLRAFVAAAEAMLRDAGGQTKAEREAATEKAADGSAGSPEPNKSTGGPRHGAGGSSFFKAVNQAALDNLGAWVPKLFPKAKLQATGAYRVTSADLGRPYEEDLSIHPDGVRDFGPRKRLTPCDVVIEFGGAPNVTAAAFTLCEWLGRDPADLGWRHSRNDEAAPNADAETASRFTERDPLPVIRVTRGKRHEAADAGLDALAAADVHFYQRDRNLVRICAIKAKASDGALAVVPAVTPVTAPVLGRALGQASRWEAVNRNGKISPIDPPKDVVEQIGGMIDEWPFAPLYGVIATPTLRPDGSLLTTEGYDGATGLVLFALPAMPLIAEEPARNDALEALATLDMLLTEFPFANEASRSVAMSMLLTPVLRGALAPAVPMHVITAPEAGTGKSYLQDIASCIAVGDRCAVLSVASDPSETEKRLIGAALAQQPIIALDNVGELLMGDFLCQATERPLLQIRPLGTSNLTRIANTFTTFANGNNLTVGADVVRRTIQCALDANLETPEAREFAADPVAMVLADRGKYVAACLTIARAYIVAGRPRRLPRRPSYEGWSDTVHSALVWLNWPDPVDTVANVRVQDPVRQARAAVFSAWAKELQPGIGYQTAELVRAAEQYADAKRACPALWDALFAVGAPRSGYQAIDPRLLGLWLRDNLGTIAAGHKLAVDRSDSYRPRWKLEQA